MASGIYGEIESRIEVSAPGSIFSTKDFIDIASNTTVRKCLGRLVNSGKLRRIIQGIYEKPTYSQLLGEFGAPNIDSFANALARKFNWTIAPAGDTALNYLHMSTQVPNKFVYISDGPYREYIVGPYQVEFKHCANREISGRSRITIIAIQAVKAIGKNNFGEIDKRRLSLAFSDEEKKIILDEAKTATAWVYEILKVICT